MDKKLVAIVGGVFLMLVASLSWATVTDGAGEVIFDTNKTITSTTGNLVIKTSDVPGANVGGSISMSGEWYSGSSGAPLYTDFAFMQGGKETAGDGTSDAGNLRFGTRPLSSTMTEWMRLTSTGLLGVNDTSPAERLSVGGPVFLSNGAPAFTKRGVYLSYLNSTSTGNVTTYQPGVGYDHLTFDSTDYVFHTHNPSDDPTFAVTSGAVVVGSGTGGTPLYAKGGKVCSVAPSGDATVSSLCMSCGSGSSNAFNGICNLQSNDDNGSSVANYRPMRVDATRLDVRTDSSTLTGKTHLSVDATGNVGVNTEAQTNRFQVNNAMTNGTGTLASSGTAVTGTGTLFTSELHVGDTIKAVSSGSFGVDYRLVTVITDNTHLTVASAFGASLGGAAYQFNSPVFTVNDSGAVSVATTPGTSVALGTQTFFQAVYVGGVLAVATLGGVVMEARTSTIDAVTFDISVAGNTGSTNVVIRATDGTNTCDASFACNVGSGNKRIVPTGTAGTGCAIARSASITYSVQSLGNCVTPPTVLGNAQVVSHWTE